MSLGGPAYSVNEKHMTATKPVISLLRRLHYIAKNAINIEIISVPTPSYELIEIFVFKHLNDNGITFFIPLEDDNPYKKTLTVFELKIQKERSCFLQLKNNKLMIPKSLNKMIKERFGTKNGFLNAISNNLENSKIIHQKLNWDIEIIENDDSFFSDINELPSLLPIYTIREFTRKNVLPVKFASNDINRLKKIHQELENFQISVQPINNDSNFQLPSSKDIRIYRYDGFVHSKYKFVGDDELILIGSVEKEGQFFDSRKSLEDEIIRTLKDSYQTISNNYKQTQKLEKEKFMELISELYDIQHNFSNQCQDQVAKETQKVLYEITLLLQKYQDDVVVV